MTSTDAPPSNLARQALKQRIAGSRLEIVGLPDAKCVLQNEEHLVLQTSRANEFQPGDELLAIPRHVCPTCALHRQLFVIAGGQLVDRWNVASRDRWLTI